MNMKPIVIYGIAVSLVVIIILLTLIVLDDMRQEELRRKTIENINRINDEYEREMLQMESAQKQADINQEGCKEFNRQEAYKWSQYCTEQHIGDVSAIQECIEKEKRWLREC
jgi:hypothetical protein